MQNVLKFYSRPEIQQAILDSAKGREVAIKFEHGFGKRPDILRYKGDVLELAKKGATSFHISEERWTNPLSIQTGMSKAELEKIRSGWDLLIDIDCPEIEYSKQTAYLVIEWLKRHNIESISCKFSGNKGFHIGVPFESFPSKINNVYTKTLFPEAPRRIARYIQENIKSVLTKRIMEIEGGNIEKIAKKAGFTKKEDILFDSGKGILKINVDAIIEIDTLLISSRHLYRSVYSFNEKSGLISIPIDIDKLLEFKKSDAHPDNVKVSKLVFLDSTKASSNECVGLFTEAYDFEPDITIEEKKEYKDFESLTEAIPIEFFPPCMKNILKGLKDGKKRALFALINFLMSSGWGKEKIDELVKEWNKKNPEPMRENILLGQLRYRQNNKAMLPPNCTNTIYKDIFVCEPDGLCKRIKNPVNYSRIKIKNNKTLPKKGKKNTTNSVPSDRSKQN